MIIYDRSITKALMKIDRKSFSAASDQIYDFILFLINEGGILYVCGCIMKLLSFTFCLTPYPSASGPNAFHLSNQYILQLLKIFINDAVYTVDRVLRSLKFHSPTLLEKKTRILKHEVTTLISREN